MKGTYQVQTNHSVQTIETSIWAIRSTSKRRGAERWEGGFAKVWLPNPRTGPDCKITQSHIPLGCWSNDSDWSFHSLHGEVGYPVCRTQYVQTCSTQHNRKHWYMHILKHFSYHWKLLHLSCLACEFAVFFVMIACGLTLFRDKHFKPNSKHCFFIYILSWTQLVFRTWSSS